MDAGAEALARRAQRFGNAPAVAEDVDDVDEEARLAELIQLRAAERKEAEHEGILSSGKTRLEEAKDLVGTCPGMISEYQYYWRKLRYNNIHSLEKDEHGRPQWYLTIKDYARSAAGNEQELPSDVRPPDVLLQTTDYLLSHLLTTHPFTAVNQAFIRDRARAIVKDFTMQHVRNAPAIDAHERIVRMAALSMHIFRDQRQPDGPFDHDGERKQFVNALSSLTQFYADARNPTLPKTYTSQTHVSPHEPEFTAYWHLFSLRRPPAMPSADSGFFDSSTYPYAILSHPLFRLARTFVTLWAQSEQLVSAAENMLLSPKERAAKEAREATRGVHRFKRPVVEDQPTEQLDDEDWRPQRFEYPAGFAFPALALLRRLADPGVPWVLAAVLEASALDDIRARALWEVWQMRRGGDVLVSELVDLFGCDGPEDVRIIVDAVAEASGRAVRKLRPKGLDEIRAYRLVGSMKFPLHFSRAQRNTRLIDSKRPTHAQLVDVVNQPWDQTTNGYDLTVEDIPDLVLPDRVDIEDTDAAKSSTGAAPSVARSVPGLETSRGGAPFSGFGTGAGAGAGGAFGTGTTTNGIASGSSSSGVFAGFGAVAGKPNPFGSTATANGGAGKTNPFGAPSSGTSPFGDTSNTTNPFGAKPNQFGGASTTPANPFGASSSSTPTSNPFGAKPASGAFGLTNGSGFGTNSSPFGAGAGAFGAGAGAFGAGAAAFGPKTTSTPTSSGFSAPAQSTKPSSPPTSKLSPFAASFVPKFSIPSAPAARPSQPPAPTSIAPAPEVAGPLSFPSVPAPTPEPVKDDTSAVEAAKAAREAKLKEKIEAAKREEARIRAEEERRAQERRKREELERQEEEARERQAEIERQRLATERQQLEAQQRQEQAEREQQARAVAEANRQRRERLHATTAQLLLGDILEILVVPEVQYAVEHEKRNRVLVQRAFDWWKTRAAKRAKRRQVLENMGLGRVGVAGAAGEVGELFDEEDEEGVEAVVVYERKRTVSLRESRTDVELAAAMAKAAAERERLWAPGVFFDIAKQTVANVARQQGKTLDDVPGWDIWLCTSGANKSSAEWLRKKLNARPTQLVDGTVSIAAITPSATKKDSAPGLVVFECSPYLGAAMNEEEWSNAWSNEANRIARLFSAMSNHSSYTPSLLFVVWSTDHVVQHAEVITRKIKKAASHLADVSVQGEPAVAVLVDDTVEEVFEEALASLDLDIEGRPLVEQSLVTESLSKQLSAWHRTLSHTLSRIPSFDDEDNAPHLAQVISVLLRAFNIMVAGVLQLSSLRPQHTIYLPEFSATAVQDTRSLYTLADTYISSLAFAESVDLNVLRSAVRQYRHSGKPFPARFFCERIAQLVDISLTPLVSGSRPRSDVHAAESTFDTALGEAMVALDARTKKRTQDNSPVRDNKKPRRASTGTSTKPKPNGETGVNSETSGAAKLRALLDKTRNRWANETGGT